MITCEQSGLLMHALMDGELDAGNAHEVEAHLVGCPTCAAQLRQHRALRQALAEPTLRYKAPTPLRHRVEAALGTSRRPVADRRSLLKGLVMGSMLSAAATASIVVVSLRV